MSAAERFELQADYSPQGDQPAAIEALVRGLSEGQLWQVLLGATGTGKTFTMANVIAQLQRPTLVISHNKTLAAQLYEEFRDLFPRNAVSYFVSYYDYFQPEAYIPQRDIYIEKDSSRNADLDRLRLAATSNILSRRDTIVVASVSCIYGLGSPEEYLRQTVMVDRRDPFDRRKFLEALTRMQYTRNDVAPQRGNFRVRGDVLELFPAAEEGAIRICHCGEQVESIERFDALTGEVIADENRVFITPAQHYMMAPDRLEAAVKDIQLELDERCQLLRAEGKLLEMQRLISRTRYDLELLTETGMCLGIENYSRHLERRPAGSRSSTLMDYFRMATRKGDQTAAARGDWLVFVDESHVTLPQIRGMQHGDRARKQTLVEHGFRLPSALDNRPLTFEEWTALTPQTICVSATPGPWELEKSSGVIVEQVIRPTGLVDPPIEVRSARGQVADVVAEAERRAARGERTLVTALTKRLCEDLTVFMDAKGLRVRYLHSEVETLDRIQILRDLREGAFDVLVGVNLLREGLDLPEVALVCILDADKQGFLRSASSLIQTMGRAARNANSVALLYADTVTPQMQQAIDEVERRRSRQLAHNAEHGIVPQTIRKSVRRGIETEVAAGRSRSRTEGAEEFAEAALDRDEAIRLAQEEMIEAAQMLEFERAALLRDEVGRLKALPAESTVRRSNSSPGAPNSSESDGTSRLPPGAPGTRARRGKGRRG